MTTLCLDGRDNISQIISTRWSEASILTRSIWLHNKLLIHITAYFSISDTYSLKIALHKNPDKVFKSQIFSN